MNFLLHHHLATRDLGSTVAGVGAMLPDVWRMVDRRVRPRSGADPPTDAGPASRLLLAGVEHHLAADEVFHRHPAFTRGERRLTERFRDAEIAADKIGLFAHIAWELCLDGALLARRGTDDVLGDLRDGLHAASRSALAAAVRTHHDEVDDPFHERLEHLLGRIAWSDWVPGYARGDGLADRVSGVRRRVGLAPLAGRDRHLVAEVLDAALADAGPALDDFLADWSSPARD